MPPLMKDHLPRREREPENVDSFFSWEVNSPQNREETLGILGHDLQAEQIPVGIEIDFQFRVPDHLNTRHWSTPIPIHNSKAKCQHPNVV